MNIFDLIGGKKRFSKKFVPRVAVLKPDSGFVLQEAYKATRTNVMFAFAGMDEGVGKVIAVTSAEPGAGTPKAGYVVDGKIMAYYYDVTKRYVELARYFDAYDNDATLTLDDNTTSVAASSTGKAVYSSDLATVDTRLGTARLTLKSGAILVAAGGSIYQNSTTNKEAGYGLPLLIEVQNEYYKDSSWKYADGTDDAKANHSFTIVVMSPIAEGKVVPAAGNTIEISANSTEGFDITKSMITLVEKS